MTLRNALTVLVSVTIWSVLSVGLVACSSGSSDESGADEGAIPEHLSKAIHVGPALNTYQKAELALLAQVLDPSSDPSLAVDDVLRNPQESDHDIKNRQEKIAKAKPAMSVLSSVLTDKDQSGRCVVMVPQAVQVGKIDLTQAGSSQEVKAEGSISGAKCPVKSTFSKSDRFVVQMADPKTKTVVANGVSAFKKETWFQTREFNRDLPLIHFVASVSTKTRVVRDSSRNRDHSTAEVSYLGETGHSTLKIYGGFESVDSWDVDGQNGYEESQLDLTVTYEHQTFSLVQFKVTQIKGGNRQKTVEYLVNGRVTSVDEVRTLVPNIDNP